MKAHLYVLMQVYAHVCCETARRIELEERLGEVCVLLLMRLYCVWLTLCCLTSVDNRLT